MTAEPTASRTEAKHKPIAGEAFLRALADHGVDYFFANPGTDFPPIIEAFSRARDTNAKVPRPILVAHENVAVAMAHGAYAMTGRAQAVMVHVNVGTANTINNLTNLSRDRVPLILAAGGSPITERGSFGSRNRPIHWAQEMFDQGGMVREVVKWDYELRVPTQVGDVVARAYEVSMTRPRGPVYLVLPREPLSAPLPDLPAPVQPRPVPAPAHPDPASVEQLAGWIAAAERPLLITASIGHDSGAVETLAHVAERWALPVVVYSPRSVCLPSSHPMHFGFEPGALLAEADLVIVIEADVPWIPSQQQPPAACRVAHVGEEPLYVRYPMRSFPSDLAIAANAGATLSALDTALARKLKPDDARVAARRDRLGEQSKARRDKIAAAGAQPKDRITPAFLSRAVGEAVGPDAVIFSEYWLQFDQCRREKPGTMFALSPAGGLGWALGAALGAKLAAPDRLIVAAIGDGAYVFTNPTAAHWVASMYDLPVLIIIYNNIQYGAVRRATMSMFKDGAAGRDDGKFLADLAPSPPFEEIVRVHGGHGERVERPEDLAGALARARDAVVKERRQALVNVICPS
jgi:acetolactate synthase-1/2/3 large subunit